MDGYANMGIESYIKLKEFVLKILILHLVIVFQCVQIYQVLQVLHHLKNIGQIESTLVL